jgi:hypothetical protein
MEKMQRNRATVEFFFNISVYWLAEHWDSSEEATMTTRAGRQRTTRATHKFSKIGKSNQTIVDLFLFQLIEKATIEETLRVETLSARE